MPGKPPGPGGQGPTSPALSGRLSIMQRGRLGRLNDNCRRRQGLDQPGRVAVPGRALLGGTAVKSRSRLPTTAGWF